MSSSFRVSCLSLILCVTAVLVSSTAMAGDKPKHSMVVQTFEPARNNGTPLVQVRFSNTLIGTFIVDTGEIESVITEPFAQKAGFKLTEDDNSLAIGLHHVRFVQPSEIKLENLTLVKPTFRVVSQDFLPYFNGHPVDGILGGNFLSQFALRIDYPAHEIGWIIPGNLSGQEAADLGFAPQNRIELGQENSSWVTLKISHYSLRADLQNGANAASEEMFIDTGSPATLVSAELAEKLHLPTLTETSIKILDRPAAPYHQSTIAGMQIGQSALTNVSVLAAERKATDIPSILGANVLSDCVVLFDFGPHRFYLKPVLPPTRPEGTALVDKTQIVWDRLRAAPDLPTVEEMLADGFAPDAQDTLSEQAARLQTSDVDSAKDTSKDIVRLEKLGALMHLGQDNAGAKTASDQAVTLAKTAAAVHPEDGRLAGLWVNALILADRDDEAIAVATQTTVHLPDYAPGWWQLGDVLMSHALFLLSGERFTLSEAETLRLMQNVPDSVATPRQAALLQPLLTQAYAAFNRAIALAPADARGYRERGLFRLTSRIALTSMQQVNIKITLPAPEVPSVDTAQALAIADWQQWGLLSESKSPHDRIQTLREIAYLDRNMPDFHDRLWLTTHLKGKSVTLPSELMTADMAQTRLTRLTQDADKGVAASAWAALGDVQSQDSSSHSDSSSKAAEASWRQALALDPTQSDALRALAAYLHRAGRWAELRDLLTHQATVCDTVPTRLALAAVLNAENLPADAETQVRAAKALAPNTATVNLILAELLLARSSEPAALSEAAGCLSKARIGYGTLATAEQKATLTTTQAVWLALDHDPEGAEKQLVALAKEEPTCTQAREALAALLPYQ